MQVKVSFKGMEANKRLSASVQDKFCTLGDHLYPKGVFDITVWEYEKKKVADVRFTSGKVFLLAKCHSDDFEKTFELLKNKMKSQMLKKKEATKNKVPKGR